MSALRDLLTDMAEDAIIERRPKPSRFCADCKAGHDCDDHRADRERVNQYNLLRLQIGSAATVAELAALLPRLDAVLAGTEKAS